MATNSREHILETAFVLFMQRSFKAVTMNEIVECTGLSKGAFYHYFTSKEQVFEEVVNTYFMKITDLDYSKLSQESLKDFYTELTEKLIDKSQFIRQIRLAKETGESLNYFQLLFNAISLSSTLKEKILEVQKKELKAWTKIIGIAKSRGEIQSDLSNAELAKLFIYANDGTAMNGVMRNSVNGMNKEILTVYNNLYSLIKV